MIKKAEGAEYPSIKEETFSRIAINIRNLSKEKQKIILTGSIDIAKLQEVRENIANHLKDIELITVSNINLRTDALKMLSESDAAILVEERNVSLISSIRKEHENINILNKHVIGYILL